MIRLLPAFHNNNSTATITVLKTRILTALVLAPIVIGGIFFLQPLGFALFTGAIMILGAWEWANMAGMEQPARRAGYALGVAVLLYLLAGVPAVAVMWLALVWWLVCYWLVRRYPAGTDAWGSVPARAVMGLFVLVPAWMGLNYLRTSDVQFGDISNSLIAILYVFLVVWVADVGAYFAGRAFGKAKLAPRVSPGKSWAGVWGGLVAVAALAVSASLLANAGVVEAALLVIATVITGFVSVLGDLLESMLKRFRGIKDSSQLLPGHGGILDRIDSLTAAIPVFSLMVTLLGWLTVGPV